MASIGLLTAGLAHEINNPINYVAGNIGAIKRNLHELKQVVEKNTGSTSDEHESIRNGFFELYDEMDSLMEGIEEGTERVVSIIRDLSTFSENNNAKESGAVSIKDCIESTLNLVKYHSEKRITFSTNLKGPPVIFANGQKFKQVCLNVLTNACQAIKVEGEVKISSFRKDNYLHIQVSDTGEGVLPENVNRIFEPFFTTKEVGEGTGLGLAISYNILKEFGGHINLMANSEHGATFEIVMPLNYS
jgi:two-component system NtrC family sensor kinase